MKKSYVYNRSEARKKLASLVNVVKDSNSTVYISERGKKQAVLMSYEAFRKLTSKLSQSKKILPFARIWKDRTDIKDSVNWVSDIRKQSERGIV